MRLSKNILFEAPLLAKISSSILVLQTTSDLCSQLRDGSYSSLSLLKNVLEITDWHDRICWSNPWGGNVLCEGKTLHRTHFPPLETSICLKKDAERQNNSGKSY